MWCQVQATPAVSGQGCPLVRTKHAMCFTADGHIYLYGGRSMANKALRDLWRFDTAQDQWEEVLPRSETVLSRHYLPPTDDRYPVTNSSRSSSSNSSAESSPLTPENKFEPPPALQEHTIVAAKNKLYLFGGQVGYSSDETPLWIFDLVSARWSKFSGKTSPRNVTAQPLGRRGHTAVLYRNLMSIYGGYQDLKGSTSELWTFNIERQEWTNESFQKCSSPPARHAHSAVVHKDSMFVYGGMTDLQVRGDFWSWSYKTKKWTRIKTMKNPGDLCCHSAIVVNDSMFIYGGEREDGNSISELWRYRFDSQTWQHVNVDGIIPGCRTRHVAVAIPFFNVFDTDPGLDWNFSLDEKTKCETIETSFTSATRREQETQVDFEPNYKAQPKKSISFDSMESAVRARMSPLDTEPKKKIIKSNSFRLGRRSPMVTSFCRHSDTLSDEEELTDTITQLEVDTENVEKSDRYNLENDQNVTNLLNECPIDPSGQTTPQVRMRPRRPLLQRQRPYSDFYATSNLNEEFELGELTEKQLKRRSVQESMSYYSLCFPTPPASLKLNHSPSVVPMSPVIEPPESQHAPNPCSSPLQTPSKSFSSDTFNHEVVRRRDNLSIKRRMRKANLELREPNTALISSSESSNFNSAYYSLSLDISPDFEKELKCATALSTPSHELSNQSMENYGSESEEMAHVDLDLIEDYLEPEEMLEIVTDSFDEQTSPMLKMKTIIKTPARRRRSTHKDTSTVQEPRCHRAPSVSHSSSGYQSLILADGVPTASLDLMSNPSLSNSSSFADHTDSQQEKHFLDNLNLNHTLTRSITLNLTSNRRVNHKMENIELKAIKSPEVSKSHQVSARTRSLERVQEAKGRACKPHWQPNITEVIREVIVPRSPAIHKPELSTSPEGTAYFDGTSGVHLQLDGSGGKKKTGLSSMGRRHKSHHGVIHNWQLCMYVFGGREGTASALLNKQPITIWKLYI